MTILILRKDERECFQCRLVDSHKGWTGDDVQP